MLKIDCDLKGIENYIIDTQISVQKVLKKSLNAAINKAHKEGYKIVKQEFGISKEEYKKKRTKLRKVRMSNFKHFNVSVNISEFTYIKCLYMLYQPIRDDVLKRLYFTKLLLLI